ncbi:hypothetical protein NDU88_012065 [Pleurodeles waltl]|uniref:Uncharacterized protein n=1 Tax=Pleurodeles waltl TaxID=8319 RepID=A0AAV7R370_PLEWA|nr:hypothetical protein NDU88_012065 [Pleurodeles waltl]
MLVWRELLLSSDLSSCSGVGYFSRVSVPMPGRKKEKKDNERTPGTLFLTGKQQDDTLEEGVDSLEKRLGIESGQEKQERRNEVEKQMGEEKEKKARNKDEKQMDGEEKNKTRSRTSGLKLSPGTLPEMP